MGKKLKILYDCERCPAYCCSYPRIILTRQDIRRLAKFFGLSQSELRRKYLKKGEEPGELVIRHWKDDAYGSVCRFLDRETRMCTVYRARPKICREFPGTRRCGYWDFLQFERDLQEDPEFIATAYNA